MMTAAIIFISYQRSRTKDQVSVQLDKNAEIKAIFEKYLSEKTSNSDSAQYFKLIDNQDKAVSLDKFADSIGLRIDPSVAALLDDANYSLFSCFQNEEKIYGIVLNSKAALDSPASYEAMAKAMGNWEPMMFDDTKSILFPYVTDSNFLSLNNNIIFKDEDFRYTDITLPDGSKKAINYYIVSDSIIITTSKECLYKTL